MDSPRNEGYLDRTNFLDTGLDSRNRVDFEIVFADTRPQGPVLPDTREAAVE